MAKGKQPNPTDRHVGARVRLRRMQKQMSQTDLGTALGITFQQVQKYEKGTNRVSASKLQMMSKVLGVPVSWFFEGLSGGSTVTDKDAAAANEFMASPDGIALMTTYMGMSPKLRRSVRLLVETVAGMA